MALRAVPRSTVALPPIDGDGGVWPCRVIVAGGLRLSVRETPCPRAGTVRALFVHGLGGSAMNWTDLAGQLREHAEGIAVDLPGFGQSEPPRWYSFTPVAQADAVIAAIEKLGGSAVHLLGNSLGGLTSVLVAVRRPDLVRTLTLVSPAVPDLRPDPRRMSDPRLPLCYLPVIGHRFRRSIETMTPQQRLDQLKRLCFADPQAVSAARWQEAVTEFAERDGMPWVARALGLATVGMFRAWLVPGPDSPWQLLRRVEAPTLVLWGDRDRLISVRKAVRTVRSLRRGRLLVLPNTGHVAQMERPVHVARAVLGMWEAVAEGTW